MNAPCAPAFLLASAVPTVLIGGAPALVTGGATAPPCGAAIGGGAATVRIGG